MRTAASNMAVAGSRVEIGFLEKSEPWLLESRFFPSKVGGRPAWLDLKNIGVDVRCGQCRKPCVFLCQLYAPLTDLEHAYHRTLFVFICKDPTCSRTNDNGNFIVYRCQLRRVNEFYSVDEPVESVDWCPDANVERYSRTCTVCGCFGPNQCGKCKGVRYCSREHQVIDWKAGHNKKCGADDGAASSADILFPEFEILNESEIQDDEDEAMLMKPPEKTEEERLRDYEGIASQLRGGSLGDVDPKIMEEFALCKEDKYFKKFKDRLKICPDQVIRYDRGGEPLWISEPDDSTQIPDCEVCGGPREFEFQILPTLLNSLEVDSLEKSIDWGTLMIFTCKNSCIGAPPYTKEFLLKQDAT